MAFKMKYNKGDFPFKKTETENMLITGARAAAQGGTTADGFGDEGKAIDLLNPIASVAGQKAGKKVEESKEDLKSLLTLGQG